MQYHKHDEQGNIIREFRHTQSNSERAKNNGSDIIKNRGLARQANGYVVNKRLDEQRAARREVALRNAAARAQRSVAEQLAILATRPGESAREVARLQGEISEQIDVTGEKEQVAAA